KYLQQIHTRRHIAMIDDVEPSEMFDLSIGSAARMAVAHILGAVRDVCSGRLRNAFCSIRPPGHHVMNSGELGFCCFANVVIAACYARKVYGTDKRILIVDWDFHQGNGTHHFICGETKTFFFETFNPTMFTTQCNDFITVRNGGTVPEDVLRINVRMSPGSTNDDFVEAFERYLIPAAERFRPELVLVSSGFDCKKHDALGTFQVTAHGISKLTRIVRQIADTWAGGKLVSLLEGGYRDLPRDETVPGREHTYSGLAQCAENHVKTLLTGDVEPETPFFSSATTMSMYRRQTVIKVENDWITGLPVSDRPLKITIADDTGHIVTSLHSGKRSWVDLKGVQLAKGSYTITVYHSDSTVLTELPLLR
ncbi:MAG: hypothetical protein JW863_12245, partial [Chitinispirillaceae bacterium]|nr:hypothetical protein [Chitinispirillaceae bacterium]